MIVERTRNEIIIRLPGNIDISALQDMSDYFRYVEISSKSKASQNDVDALVKTIKKGRWNRAKEKLMK